MTIEREHDPLHRRLHQLWNEGSRAVALSFLRRAVRPEMSLVEFAAILHFDAVRDELSEIKLSDVVHLSRPRSTQQSSSSPRLCAVPSRPRRRRRPEQTEAMLALLLQALDETPAGLTTPALCERLAARDLRADPPTVTLLLRTLESNKQLVGDNSRPKRWIRREQGRRVPAPVVIRKAECTEI